MVGQMSVDGMAGQIGLEVVLQDREVCRWHGRTERSVDGMAGQRGLNSMAGQRGL